MGMEENKDVIISERKNNCRKRELEKRKITTSLFC